MYNSNEERQADPMMRDTFAFATALWHVDGKWLHPTESAPPFRDYAPQSCYGGVTHAMRIATTDTKCVDEWVDRFARDCLLDARRNDYVRHFAVERIRDWCARGHTFVTFPYVVWRNVTCRTFP